MLKFSKLKGKVLEEQKIKEYAEIIIKTVDWDNETLMHKGIGWLARRYISKIA